MATPQKVTRPIPQAGGKRAPYVRRFRRAQMAGMYVPAGGRAETRTEMFRPSVKLDPSRVRDMRGQPPVAEGPFWDLRRAAYNLSRMLRTEGKDAKDLYQAQERARRMGEASRRGSAQRTANPFNPNARLNPSRITVRPVKAQFDPSPDEQRMRQYRASGARKAIRLD